MRKVLNFLKNKWLRLAAAALIVAAVAAPAPPRFRKLQQGIASYYGTKKDGFLGRTMASGRVLTSDLMICAHRTLPFGQLVQVTNLLNGKSVVCVVADRGPYVRGRVVDVSHAAAKLLGMELAGTAKVSVETLSEDLKW